MNNFHNAPDETVHEVRKNMKKLRALLKLLHYFLPNKLYKKLNNQFRDTAKAFANARDAKVRWDTALFFILNDKWPDTARFISYLYKKEYEEAMTRLTNEQAKLDLAKEKIPKAKHIINNLSIKDISDEQFFWKLKKVFYNSEQKYIKALKRQDDEQYHKWRKKIKQLMYEISLVPKIDQYFPELFEEKLDDLSDLLGGEHDLAMFKTSLINKKHFCELSLPEQEKLLASVNERKSEIRNQANWLGNEIYVNFRL